MNPASKSEQKPQKLRERLKEAARAAILEAAEAVFSEQGIHRARMEDIATQAGVSVGTLYNYFEDRQALLSALLEQQGEDLMEKVERSLAELARAPFAERLAHYLRTVLEHFTSHAKLFTILVEDEVETGRTGQALSRQRSMLRQMRVRLEKLVQAGIAEGALKPEGAELYPDFLSGMLRGLFSRTVEKRGALSPESAEPIVRLFLDGAGKDVS